MFKLLLFIVYLFIFTSINSLSVYAQNNDDLDLNNLLKQLEEDEKAEKNDGLSNIQNNDFNTNFDGNDQKIRFLLKPRQIAILSAKISGRVIDLPLKEGERFKKNDLLMAMDCTLEVAESNIARTDLQSAELTFKSNQRLFQRNSLGQVELKQSEIAYEKSKAQYEQTQSRIRQCFVYAPFNGRIAQRVAKEFEYIGAGQPAMEIFDDSNFEISLIVPSSWLDWLRIGYKFQTVIDETGETLNAQVTRIGSKIDSISKSITITGELIEKSDRLIYGMSGSAFFNQSRLTQ